MLKHTTTASNGIEVRPIHIFILKCLGQVPKNIEELHQFVQDLPELTKAFAPATTACHSCQSVDPVFVKAILHLPHCTTMDQYHSHYLLVGANIEKTIYNTFHSNPCKARDSLYTLRKQFSFATIIGWS